MTAWLMVRDGARAPPHHEGSPTAADIQTSAEQRIEQQLDVQDHDDASHNPGRGGDWTGYDKIAHLAPIGDEPHQRNDRERKLHRQHDLTEDKQLSGAAFAIQRSDDNDRDNGDATGKKSPRPAWETQMKEAFHDDLAGKRRGHGRVEAGGE